METTLRQVWGTVDSVDLFPDRSAGLSGFESNDERAEKDFGLVLQSLDPK